MRAVMVLSENWTFVSPRDLTAVVDLAVEAEAAGVDTVMLSEHIVLGESAGALGRMENPRDYAAPGNQDPATPWPDSVVLASAIAARTTTLRVALAAVITPLRHPLQLAKQLGTLDLLAKGRLVVQPTVSWSGRSTSRSACRSTSEGRSSTSSWWRCVRRGPSRRRSTTAPASRSARCGASPIHTVRAARRCGSVAND